MNNNLPLLIGITGKKFNGKDTLGNRLIEKYNYKRFAFADPLKEGCRQIFGLNDEQLYGSLKETIDEYWNVTPRKLLQYIGTDLFRDQLINIMPHLNKDIWVYATKRKILNEWKINSNQRIVVTDVRFENEINMIYELGGIVIRVKRDTIKNSDIHASELEIDNLCVTYELSNNETIHELYDKLDHLLLIKHELLLDF